MHKSRLIELIAHPERVTPEDRPGLADWAQRYPFVASGWMLLARASALGGSVDEQRDLLRASSHLGLRRPLYDLMHLAPAPAPEVPLLPPEVPVAAPEVPQAPPFEEAPPAAEAVPPVVEAVPPAVEAVPPAAEVVPPVVEVVPPAVEAAPDLKALEQDWLVAAVARSIELDVLEWNAARAEEERSEASEEVEEGAEPAVPEQVVQGHSPFAQWLLSSAHGAGFGRQVESEASGGREPGSEQPLQIHSPEETLKETGGTSLPRSQGPVAPTHPLIQRFIEKAPRIGPIRDVGVGVEDLARKSIEEEGEVITETMARVLAEQGATARARRLYKLLGDRYPEKRVYFAALARELGRGGGKEGEEG